MLTRIIDWSLRHRWAVVGTWLAIVVAGVLSFRRPPHRRVPRHDAGAGAGEHGRARARAARGRAADHHPGRAGARRPAEGRGAAVDLQVRPLADHPAVPGRDRPLVRAAAGLGAALPARAARGDRAARARARRDGSRRGLPLSREGEGQVARGAPDGPRLDRRPAAPERPRRGGGERLGRQREAVARGRRSAAPAEVRPRARRRLRGAREEQRQRRRRRPRSRRDEPPRARRRRAHGREGDRGRGARGARRRAGARSGTSRGSRSGTRSGAPPSPQTGRARRSSASASC